MSKASILVLMLSIVTFALAAYSILSSKLMRAALSFGGALLSLGFLYMALGQSLLGLMQIFLYVGGVAVILAFAFLTAFSVEEVEKEKSQMMDVGVVLGVLVALLLGFVFFQLPEKPAAEVREVTVKEVGNIFLTEYLFQFEFISVLLLAALISSFVFVMRGRK